MNEPVAKESLDTLCATAGQDAPIADSMVPPIYQASVFPIESLEDVDIISHPERGLLKA